VTRLGSERIRHAGALASNEFARERSFAADESVPFYPSGYVPPDDDFAERCRQRTLIGRGGHGFDPQCAVRERHIGPEAQWRFAQDALANQERMRGERSDRFDDGCHLLEPHEDRGIDRNQRVVAAVRPEVDDRPFRCGDHGDTSAVLQ
jgi:hypothetical protein